MKLALSTVLVAVTFVNVAVAQTHLLTGDAQGDAFGSSVHSAGDLDGDGFDDVIVGAPFADSSGLINNGAMSVYSGQTGMQLVKVTGGGLLDLFGRSVGTVGDLNNDGYADVLAGAFFADPNGPESGQVDLFVGPNGTLATSFIGAASGDQLGQSVSGAGDVDADGFPDLILGAWAADVGGIDSGSAIVVSGQFLTTLHFLGGVAANDAFGTSVSGAGDVNGDGFDDVVVGAYGADVGGLDSGAATIFSGQTGAPLALISGPAAGDQLGISVSGAGDADADGFADVVVGANMHDGNGVDSGGAWVYSFALGSIVHAFLGTAADDQFGGSVSDAGDVDLDGAPDVIVGAQFSDAAFANAGEATIFSGKSGAAIRAYTGNAANDHFGRSVAGNLDADADGYADVAVGAPDFDVAAGGEGLVRIEFECLGAPIPYGTGCPGSGGFVPSFSLTGCPKPGEILTASISGGLGGSLAVLLFGQVEASLPLPGGCTLLIAPVSPISLPLPLGGIGPGNGSIVASGTVPAGTPSLTATLQAYVLDPGSPLGATLTNAVSLVIP